MKDRSRIALGEIFSRGKEEALVDHGEEERKGVFGEKDKLFESSEWYGELDGPSEV